MNFSDLYQYVYDMAMTELSHFNFAAVFAFIGAMFYVVTYYMKTMVPLRIVGIIANLFFIAYGYFYPQYLTLLLYLGILPINVYRLIEMRRLIEQVKRSADTDQSMDWLKPFMTKRTYKKGDVLFRKGDRAYEMFYVVSGKFRQRDRGDDPVRAGVRRAGDAGAGQSAHFEHGMHRNRRSADHHLRQGAGALFPESDVRLLFPAAHHGAAAAERRSARGRVGAAGVRCQRVAGAGAQTGQDRRGLSRE